MMTPDQRLKEVENHIEFTKNNVTVANWDGSNLGKDMEWCIARIKVLSESLNLFFEYFDTDEGADKELKFNNFVASARKALAGDE